MSSCEGVFVAFSNLTLTAESLVLSGMIISPNATAAIITAQGNSTFALDLSSMYLGYVETSVLAKSMNALINLRFLNMSRNMLDNAAVMVLEPMMHGLSLTSVDFSHNTFNSTGIESFAKRQFSDLKELYLSHLPLAGANLSAVGKIIESSPKLNKLVLKGNKINDDNIITFVNSLARSNLRELDLSNNDLDIDSGMYLGMNMPNSTIAKLSLSDNRLGDEGIAYFARYLSDMRSLRQIAFGNNAISNDGLKYFSAFLPLSRVDDIDFQSNQISEIGFANFALAIEQMRMVRIVLDNNVVSDQGLLSVSNGIIPSLRTLRVLSLANTGIQHVNNLFAILSNATCIDELNLQNNKLVETNYAQAVRKLPSINVTALQLRGTQITSQVMSALTETIQSSTVRVLDVSDNPIGDNNLLEFFKKILFEPVDMISASSDVIPNYEMRYIHFAHSATNLRSFFLDDVNITTKSALGLCRILPSTNIQMSSLSMVDNYIDPSKVDIRSCYTSSASHLSLPWIFSTAELAIQRLPKIDMRCAIKDSVITCEGSMLYANGDQGFFKFSTQLLKTTSGIGVVTLIECLGALTFAFRNEIGKYLSSYIPRPVLSAYRYYEDSKQCKIINIGVEMVVRAKANHVASVVHDVTFFAKSTIGKNEKAESVISKVGGALLTIGAGYGTVRLIGYLTGNALIGYALAPIFARAPRICQSVAQSYERHGFFSALGTAAHEVALAIPGGEYINDSLNHK